MNYLKILHKFINKYVITHLPATTATHLLNHLPTTRNKVIKCHIFMSNNLLSTWNSKIRQTYFTSTESIDVFPINQVRSADGLRNIAAYINVHLHYHVYSGIHYVLNLQLILILKSSIPSSSVFKILDTTIKQK